MEKTWTTFSGKKASLNTIDHQHLSNVIWFQRVFWNLREDDPFMDELKFQLDDRFNGQLLPYRPHVKFEQEINCLEKKNMLRYDTYKSTKRTIMFNGVCIGEILIP